jgi:hypothetical protein
MVSGIIWLKKRGNAYQVIAGYLTLFVESAKWAPTCSHMWTKRQKNEAIGQFFASSFRLGGPNSEAWTWYEHRGGTVSCCLNSPSRRKSFRAVQWNCREVSLRTGGTHALPREKQLWMTVSSLNLEFERVLVSKREEIDRQIADFLRVKWWKVQSISGQLLQVSAQRDLPIGSSKNWSERCPFQVSGTDRRETIKHRVVDRSSLKILETDAKHERTKSSIFAVEQMFQSSEKYE